MQAIDIINNGGVIVYSTDTILGLGCDPLNESAVNKILWLKQRNKAKGLILLVSKLEQALSFSGPLSPEQKEKIETSSCKPTTWLLPANDQTPCWIKGESDKVAIRITKHSIAENLCASLGAIVSTSANISKYPPIQTTQEVHNWFGPYVDYVIMGELGTNKPSTIVDLVSNEVIR